MNTFKSLGVLASPRKWDMIHRASGKVIATGTLREVNDLHDHLCDNDWDERVDFVREAGADESYDDACVNTAVEYLEFFFPYSSHSV